MLNKASRSRSDVGRTSFDFGPARGRERNFPPTTPISEISDTSAAAHPNDHGGGESSCRCGGAPCFGAPVVGPLANGEAVAAPVFHTIGVHRNRRRSRQ